MKRRRFLHGAIATAFATPVIAALQHKKLDEAAAVLQQAVADGTVASAVLHVVQRESSFSKAFGEARNADAMFLLGSISKPIAVMTLMTLFERGEFRLEDPLKNFIPQLTGGDRERVTMQHLLTHVSGLPDQLPENDELRRQHSPLSTFVERALRTPLQFAPGARYQYSSMAILLASHVAELISGSDLPTLMERTVFRPLRMEHSVQGLGGFKLERMVSCQTDRAAPESGGGDPTAKEWDWNSSYWRRLGAPWGGTHASALDVARFLAELLEEKGAAVKPETARLMVQNHNAPGLTPRGLGLSLGADFGRGVSERTFGHTGSTGTIAWADPATRTICVVLTSLPARAMKPHPRDVAARAVAEAAR